MRACPHCLSVYSVDAEHCSVDGEKLGAPAILRGKSIESYIFDDLLGVGGTGCVYRGHTKLGVPCAIKLLFREMASDESLIERFRREAEAVTEMDHPNVVRIFGYGTTPVGTVFIAMEYLEGKTLKDILEADAPLTHSRAGRIAEQMASGLGEAHRLGFVHRDLKPGNIMICRDRFGREQAKLLDFGIVASLKERGQDERLTKTGYIVGTPTYMAPEQIDPKQVGPQVDVYALGVMLYEMLCGQPPFRGTLEQILVAKMTEDPTPIEHGGELGELALRFLEKDPSKRPQNALQATAQLGRLALLSDDPATVRAAVPEFMTYEAAAPTVRFTEWDSEVTKPPAPRDPWTADTRRVNFENEVHDSFRPLISTDETPDLIVPQPRPDTLIDGLPAGLRDIEIGAEALSLSNPAVFALPAEPTDSDVDVPTELHNAAIESLLRDTDEDMLVPEVAENSGLPTQLEEPAMDELLDDDREGGAQDPPREPSASDDQTERGETADSDDTRARGESIGDPFDRMRGEDEPTAGDEDTHLEFAIDPPPSQTPKVKRKFPLKAVVLVAVLMSIVMLVVAFALGLFMPETVLIDVPR